MWGYLSGSVTLISVNFMFKYWSTECKVPHMLKPTHKQLTQEITVHSHCPVKLICRLKNFNIILQQMSSRYKDIESTWKLRKSKQSCCFQSTSRNWRSFFFLFTFHTDFSVDIKKLTDIKCVNLETTVIFLKCEMIKKTADYTLDNRDSILGMQGHCFHFAINTKRYF